MRYLKAALVGFVGAVLLTTAVLAVEVIHAGRSVSAQMRECTDYVCDGSAQVGGLELPVTFTVGFAAAFIWFHRRQQRLVV